MTLIKPESDNGDAAAALVEAKEHFERAIGVFLSMTSAVEQGDIATPTDIAKTIRALTGATQTLFDEKRKIEYSIRKSTGVHRGYAIDFRASRDEIGRRMACLRRSGDGGELSE